MIKHINDNAGKTENKPDGKPGQGKLKQWLWFIGLWCAGLIVVSTAGYGIKFLMSLIG